MWPVFREDKARAGGICCPRPTADIIAHIISNMKNIIYFLSYILDIMLSKVYFIIARGGRDTVRKEETP